VITAMARSAAEGVPGVAHLGRGGAVAEGAVALPDLAQRVGSAVAGAVERQLDPVLADATVVVDGVRG
jgi:hypothetical protein